MRCGRLVGWVLAVSTLAWSCTLGGSPSSSFGASGTSGTSEGGTLRVGLLIDGSFGGHCGMRVCGQPFDPQSDTVPVAFEMSHCCLMRTLLSTNGRSVSEGGTELRPDLAEGLPTVSPDGLTWTFHLKAGLHYGPPMTDTEIVAGDFVRSLERAMSPATTANQYWYPDGIIGGYFVDVYLPDVIVGARAFARGDAPHISGLEATDDHTLVVHLTEPVGDLGYRLAQPQLGPIPANPARPEDPLGVAQGHPGDYGDFMVSSGPYMFEGSDALDFSIPARDQEPAIGDGIARITLVRNPSWSRTSDSLHPAIPDRIEMYPIPNMKTAERLVRSGALDVQLDWPADPQSIHRWLARPALRDRMHVEPSDGLNYLSLNVAVPPLDDVHVRRAINLAVDRRSLISFFERHQLNSVEVFTHAAIDSLEDNLLLNYHPPSVGPGADLTAARASMARSRYDRDGDGICDAATCGRIDLWLPTGHEDRIPAAHAIAHQLRAIGLHVTVHVVPEEEPPYDPGAHRAMTLWGWAKDFPSAATFLPVMLGSDQIGLGRINDTMVGASGRVLRRFGYDVRSVPSVEDRIEACEQQLFGAQVRCFADLDQYISEEVVPIVPLTQTSLGWAVSPRVRDFSVDAMIGVPLPSIASFSLEGEASAPPPTPPAPTPPPGLPDGLYRTTFTPGDARALHLPDLRDVTYTVALDQGWFEFHATSDDHAVWDPITVGSLTGSTSHVRFEQTAPYGPADWSRLRWKLDAAGALSFSMPRCTGTAAENHDDRFCAIQRALFTTHPWSPVAA